MEENEITSIVIELCIKIHKRVGPGLLESVYEEILCYELKKLNIPFKRQEGIKVIYDDIEMDIGFRADIIIADKVIIELKSIELIAPVHKKRLLTYLSLCNLKVGLLINFNVELLKDGITRIVNNF